MTAPEPHAVAAVEVSRPVSLAQIGTLDIEREVVATPAECAAVAARLLIPAIAALSCRFRLMLAQDGVVVAEGVLAASFTQLCVVSTEEFDTELREVFRIRFVPAELLVDSEDDLLDLDADDELPYHGIQIELGEATVEQLALALDPYPRKPGAELPAAPGEEAAAASPFAALARRSRQGS